MGTGNTGPATQTNKHCGAGRPLLIMFSGFYSSGAGRAYKIKCHEKGRLYVLRTARTPLLNVIFRVVLCVLRPLAKRSNIIDVLRFSQSFVLEAGANPQKIYARGLAWLNAGATKISRLPHVFAGQKFAIAHLFQASIALRQIKKKSGGKKRTPLKSLHF